MNKSRSISRQSSIYPGIRASTANPRSTARVTLLIILGSETVFFGTMLSAYFFLRAAQTDWPLTHAPLARLILPGANTLLLLASAFAAYMAQRASRQGRQRSLQNWALLTLGMGLVFVGGQAFEFIRSGMQPSDQAFGGVFFTLMGFHALHMLAGVVVMAMVYLRTRAGDFTAQKHIAVDVGAWFWFYVVGVWVVLFSALYLI